MGNVWLLLTDALIILILIVGIWLFRTPQRARSGNLWAAGGLLCALVVVGCTSTIREPAVVVAAVAVGSLAGCLVAWRVNMIQIPALVAFQNGAGGLAASITSLIELTRGPSDLAAVGRLSGTLGIVVGAVALSGSLVATAKLAGLARQTPVILPWHGWIHVAAVTGVVLCGSLAFATSAPTLVYASFALVLLSLLWGVVFAMKVGGADMPVLISFLNATTGFAAALCGVTIQNRLLIACGAVVAASGSVLTHAMCRAMNRNLLTVLIGADGKPAVGTARDSDVATASDDVSAASPVLAVPNRTPLSRAVDAVMTAGQVIVIPGYGMALAHAQGETVQLARRLQKLGKAVRFAVHPIAGRMPGHMHVLLAEADVDPDLLFDLAEINAEFRDTDLVVIVGACDVVNPAAIHVPGTPISGMPILAAHEARHVVVCNLDDQPGYSGVANPLYADPKTILLLGDAKATLAQLLESLDDRAPASAHVQE